MTMTMTMIIIIIMIIIITIIVKIAILLASDWFKKVLFPLSRLPICYRQNALKTNIDNQGRI